MVGGERLVGPPPEGRGIRRGQEDLLLPKEEEAAELTKLVEFLGKKSVESEKAMKRLRDSGAS